MVARVKVGGGVVVVRKFQAESSANFWGGVGGEDVSALVFLMAGVGVGVGVPCLRDRCVPVRWLGRA